MKNCDGDADKLRELIPSIVNHYKVDHTKCNPNSRCRVDNPYIPSKIQITTKEAETILINYLKKTAIYKNTEAYRFCLHMHYVESFNNSLLQYHDKRIAFGEANYELRMALAVLDWNEHVDRPATSEHQKDDPRNPRRQQPVKVLSKKKYCFKTQVSLHWLDTFYQ